MNKSVGPFVPFGRKTFASCFRRPHPGHKSHPRFPRTAAIYVIFLPLSWAPRNKLNQALGVETRAGDRRRASRILNAAISKVLHRDVPGLIYITPPPPTHTHTHPHTHTQV
jgi:hypothetical protein